MRDWIAGAMTVLGTLLVLSGATTIVLRAWLRPAPAAATEVLDPAAAPAVTAPERGLRSLVKLGDPDRLIAWGIVLLVLAAISAGAIGFELGASATAK